VNGPARWRAMDKVLRERHLRLEVFWNASGRPPCFTARVLDGAGRFAPPVHEGHIWASGGATAVEALEATARLVLAGLTAREGGAS
jgi:hypothetical protein